MDETTMPGDWIKIEKTTPRKTEVLRIADLLNVEPDKAFALCFRFWCWCDDNLHDPLFDLSQKSLDVAMAHPGLAQALTSVGWLRVRGSSLEVPNFDRHLSQSAKSRADATLRQRKSRSKDVTEERDKSVTPLLLLNGFMNSKKVPEELRNQEFFESWNKWVKHRAEIKKKLTDTQMDSQLKMLANLGLERAIAMLEHTIAMGWQGLREPEKNGKHPANAGHSVTRVGPGQRFKPATS